MIVMKASVTVARAPEAHVEVASITGGLRGQRHCAASGRRTLPLRLALAVVPVQKQGDA